VTFQLTKEVRWFSTVLSMAAAVFAVVAAVLSAPSAASRIGTVSAGALIGNAGIQMRVAIRGAPLAPRVAARARIAATCLMLIGAIVAAGGVVL
jgi:hypothetical protein